MPTTDECLTRAEEVLNRIRQDLINRKRRDESLDVLATTNNRTDWDEYRFYLTTTFIMDYAFLFRDQDINILGLKNSETNITEYYVVIGSIRPSETCPITVVKEYLKSSFPVSPTNNAYTLANFNSNNPSLVLVDVVNDRCFDHPFLTSKCRFIKKSPNHAVTYFVDQPRLDNVLACKKDFAVTCILNYSSSDLIESADNHDKWLKATSPRLLVKDDEKSTQHPRDYCNFM